MVPVGVDLDLLQYWKTFSHKYPILGCLARDVLAIPASTVALESAFSTAEKTISDYRSRLASDTVEALICLQDWIRGKDTTLKDIAGNIIGDENENDDGDDNVTENFSFIQCLRFDCLRMENVVAFGGLAVVARVSLAAAGRTAAGRPTFMHTWEYSVQSHK